MHFSLPPKIELPDGRMMLLVTFGTSSKLSDVDNLLKPFIDSLQDKYGFNDRDIYAITSAKKDVPKGSEFVEWELMSIEASCEFMEAIKDI